MAERLTIRGFFAANPPVVIDYAPEGGLVVTFPEGFTVDIPRPQQPEGEPVVVSFSEGFSVSFPGDSGLRMEVPGNPPVDLDQTQGGRIVVDLPTGGTLTIPVPFKRPSGRRARLNVQVAGVDISTLSVSKTLS